MTAMNKARKGGRRAKRRTAKGWAVVRAGKYLFSSGDSQAFVFIRKSVARDIVQRWGNGYSVVPCEISYQVKA